MKEKIRDFLKQNWLKASLLVIIVVMVGGAFYWYEWRPSQIRKKCYFYLQIGGGFVDEKTADGLPSLKMIPVPSDRADEFYRDCLRQYGLEK